MKKFQIQQFDLNGNLVATYNNGQEAATAVGCSKMAISYNINGKQAQCAGYIFKKVSLKTTNQGEAAPSKVSEELTAKVLKLYDRVFGYTMTLVGNIDNARDITQHTYLRFFETGHKEGTATVFTHLCGIAKSICKHNYSVYISHSENEQYLDDSAHILSKKTSDIPTTEELEERDKKLAARRKALLSELDKRVFSTPSGKQSVAKLREYKSILVLYIDGYTRKEMATKFGCSEGTMSYKIFAMRKLVCKRLGISIKEFNHYNCLYLDKVA